MNLMLGYTKALECMLHAHQIPQQFVGKLLFREDCHTILLLSEGCYVVLMCVSLPGVT